MHIDVIFGRWDTATKVSELVHKFQRTTITHTHTHTHTEGMISKVSQFQIINFIHTHCLFQVLSTVQETWVSWALWENPHHNIIHFSRNLEMACHTARHSYWKIQYEDSTVFEYQFEDSAKDSKRVEWVRWWLQRYNSLEALLWSFW